MLTVEEAKFVLEVADEFQDPYHWGHIDDAGSAHL